MKRLLFVLGLMVIGAAASSAVYLSWPVHVYDAFESEGLSWVKWSRQRFVPGAVIGQENVVRAGRRALAITVRNGDRFEPGIDGSASTERDELMEALWLFSHTGKTYAYSFSLYLPDDFPQTRERLVLAQWRQLCEAKKCRPDRPIIAIRYEDGRLQVTRQNQEEKVVLYQGTEEVRGRWLDFRFVVGLETGNEGKIVASLNGQEIVNYRGATLFAVAPGYPRHGFVYFKTGLYRDALGEPPWTMYVDEYRKDECGVGECR
jgi:hypothetical protein